MHQATWAYFLILFAMPGLWSQTPTPVPKGTDTLPPAVRDPGSTAVDLAVPLCSAKFEDSLATDGIASEIDNPVIPPKAKYTPEAEFSDEARSQRKIRNFAVVISLVVDTKGKPQDVCLRWSAGYGLDAKAAESVHRWQFTPASKDGKPVAVRIYTVVKFHLY